MTGPFGDGAFGTEVFSSSPLYNTKTLIDAILRDTGHSNPSTETNKRLAVLGYLNNVYAYVSTKRPWDWLYQTVDFIFKKYESDGTISIDNRSQTVTGVGTLFSSTMIPNNVLTISSRSDRYVIQSIESETSLTLEGPFAGEDIVASGFRVLKPIYTAPSDLETFESIVLGDDQGELVPVGTQEMNRKRARDLTMIGPPRWFTEIGRRAADGVRTFEIYPAPDRDYTAQLSYRVNIQKLDDAEDSFPLVPDRHRVVLYYGAMAEMFMFLRDPESAAIYDKRFQMTLINMQGDAKLTDSKYILRARRGRTGRRRRRFGITMDINDFARLDEWP